MGLMLNRCILCKWSVPFTRAPSITYKGFVGSLREHHGIHSLLESHLCVAIVCSLGEAPVLVVRHTGIKHCKKKSVVRTRHGMQWERKEWWYTSIRAARS
jgi:hypothetical protein